MTLALRPSADGVLVPVRVVPRASRTGIDGVVEGVLRVRMAAPPVEGAANRALCAFLAKQLGVPRRDVEIISGERGRQKTVLVRGVDEAMVRGRLLVK